MERVRPNLKSIARSPGQLLIGVAGWSLASRYAAEFPPGDSHLERYAKRLNAVEINSSFYKPHRTETYARWADSTPEGFRFAVKTPKTITHEFRLIHCDALLERFAAEVHGLGAKLGVLLVQLPPSLVFEATVVAAFLAESRKHIGVPIAIEPRHPSWFTNEADATLRDLGVSRVAADPPVTSSGGRPGGSLDLRYYRWHGSPKMYYSDYDEAALKSLGAELDEQRASCRSLWCVFDNTASGAALENALALAAVSGQGGNAFT
jgi:uncharacterized protein YecE (DUF72 family)